MTADKNRLMGEAAVALGKWLNERRDRRQIDWPDDRIMTLIENLIVAGAELPTEGD